VTPEEREAVRALLAALPKCSDQAFCTPPSFCGAPATWTGLQYYEENQDRSYYCDAHAGEDWKRRSGSAPLDYAPALRKLQAMLDPEEPSGFVAPDVVGASRVVEVNMGPHLGTYRIPIDDTETTAEVAEKVRAVLPKEWGAVASVAPKR